MWFARARGLVALLEAVVNRALAFGALMLGSLALEVWMVPAAKTPGALALIFLFAAGAALEATLVLAQLFRRAAEAVEDREKLEAF